MKIAQYFLGSFLHSSCDFCGARMQVLPLDENDIPIDPMSLYGSEDFDKWVNIYVTKTSDHATNCTETSRYLNDPDVYYPPPGTNSDACQKNTDCPYNAG